MPQARQIDLSAQQIQEVTWVRDHHEKAYLRERAAAILKVAEGLSMRQVAAHGLLKKRRYETVSDWIRRYEQQGLEGVRVQAGRGRKPAFSPCGRSQRGRAGRSRPL